MTRRKAYLIAVALLCAAIAAWPAAAAVRMYLEGAAAREAGELFHYAYTREKVVAALAPMGPLVFAALGMVAAGWLLGIRNGGESGVAAPAPLPDRAAPQRPGRPVLALRAALLALAAALIVAGVLNGGLEDVLTKASAICMECVGLG